jgi:hypothetical protein
MAISRVKFDRRDNRKKLAANEFVILAKDGYMGLCKAIAKSIPRFLYPFITDG